MSPAPINSLKPIHDERRRLLKIARAINRGSADADFLIRYIAEDLVPRINAINRDFSVVADFYSLSTAFSSDIADLKNVHKVIRVEATPVAQLLKDTQSTIPDTDANRLANLDLVVSVLGLHWQNDLQTALDQIFSTLKPDGLFIGAIPISGTLHELRDCLTLAELEICNGAALRVDPFIELQKCGDYLQQAGFKLPVIDREQVIVRYDTMTKLIEDLRSMAATGPSTASFISPTPFVGRKMFERANEIYSQKYSDSDGRIRATFNFAYLTAWAPHGSQQKPLQPGSARQHLADALKR